MYQYEVLIRDLYTSRVEMPLAAFRGHAEEPCILLLLQPNLTKTVTTSCTGCQLL